MLKVLLLSAVIFFAERNFVNAQPSALPPPKSASDILAEAYKTAALEDKNVFIMFHASWCGWCNRMDTSMNDDVYKDFFNDNYVIRHLVVNESPAKKHLENPGAEELKVKYHGEGQGIPFWLVFDKDGNLLADSKIRKQGDGPEDGDNAGCPATEKEVDFFLSVLKKTSSINGDQREQIRQRFRKNDQ
jgi:thioredoxin-related protein